jgi:hypothetical protein
VEKLLLQKVQANLADRDGKTVLYRMVELMEAELKKPIQNKKRID